VASCARALLTTLLLKKRTGCAWRGDQAASKYIKQHHEIKDDKQNPIETVRVATLAQAREPVQWDRNQPWNEELLDPLMKQRQRMCTYNDRDTAGFNTSAFLHSV